MAKAKKNFDLDALSYLSDQGLPSDLTNLDLLKLPLSYPKQEQQVPEFLAPEISPERQRISELLGEPQAKPRSIVRDLSRILARGGEELVGTPRNILEFGQMLGNIPLGALTGQEAPLGESVPFLPTAETAKEYITKPLSEVITGEKDILEAKTPGEKFLDEIIETATPLLFGGTGTLPVKAMRALGVSGAANLAKLGAKKIGLGEFGQGVVKIGTLLGTSMIGMPRARTYASKLYDSAAKNIPEDALVEFGPIRKQIQEVRKGIRGGLGERLTVDSKEFLQDFISDVEGHLRPNGRSIPLKELFRVQKDYNKILGARKVPMAAKNTVGKILGSFKESFKSAPKSLKPYVTNQLLADDIWKSTSTLNKVSKFVKSNKYLGAGAGIGGAAGLISKLFSDPVSTLLGTGGTIAGIKAADFVHKLATSPGIRSYYGNMMKSLLNKNAVAALNHANKIVKSIKKDIQKEDITTVPKKKVPSRAGLPKGFKLIDSSVTSKAPKKELPAGFRLID